MSIASEISRILNAKESLKTAINSKGGNITTERIDQFASEVASLPSPKEEETRTLTPDFSSGNQVIVPTSGKVLSQVTLTKPSDLIPENIAKDKNVCGVVGTLESGESWLVGGIHFPYSGLLPKTVEITISGKTTVTMNNTEINYMPFPADWLDGKRTLNITITNNADNRKSGYSIIHLETTTPGGTRFLSTSGGGFSTNSTYTSSISVWIDTNTVIVIDASGRDPV